MKPFKIRNIEINPPLVLSPMAGVTDYSFRRTAKNCGGIGLTVSEFISVEGLTRNNPKAKTADAFFGKRNARSPSRFSAGKSSEWFWRRKSPKMSARIFSTSTAAVPAPKVVKNGGGFRSFARFAAPRNDSQRD